MNNLELMKRRLEYQGGVQQEDRMIKGKYLTFLKTLRYSYQGCNVQLAQRWTDCLDLSDDNIDPGMGVYQTYRALINPDKLKQDYDDKILSIDYNTKYEPGDVFQWINTNTFWIIYLQQLTEDAYFRGEIRQCRWKINFKDKDGNWCATWAAVRGPVETQINSIQKNQDRVDVPNFSLNILIPRNEKTLDAFKRYKEFIFQGKCWRIETTDTIGMKNVIELTAEEYYVDQDTDDLENEMKNGLVFEEVDPNINSPISGDTFIKPNTKAVYIAPKQNGTWSVVENNVPVDIKPISNKSIELYWRKAVSGQFTLQWAKDGMVENRTVVVESLW